jgi:hypothetical protein
MKMRMLITNILKILLLSSMLFLFSIVNTSNVFATEVTVTLPTFNVTINEIAIENEYRQYPFIVYKDITYFPMTYFDSRFLGLVTEWDNLKGLEIYKTTETVEYEPYKQNWKNSNKYTASIPKFNIVVNAKVINNSTEKYPLLSFRNITYFPMTWRFVVDEFGWKYSFTSEDGLIIDSTPQTLYANPSDSPWPLIFERTFKIVDDIINIQIKSYRIAYSSKLYISINGEEQRQLGDNNYVYGVTTYKDIDNNAIGMRSNYYMELKDVWLYINAYNYQEENSSRLYKVNIETGETVPVVESDNLNYFKISSYLQEESVKVFSPYYELLNFKISDYKEEIINGNIESIFYYTMIHKNYDKDPDTVEYIKEAKEKGDSNYQQLYDEYLQPKEMNFQLKAIINKEGLITLYSNFSPKGTEWKEVKMSDFIIGE